MKIQICLVALALSAFASANAGVVFSEDFEGTVSAAIGGAGNTVTTASALGSAAIDQTTIWQNEATGTPTAPGTTLTLTGLSAYQNLTLEFDFLALASWDGLDSPCCKPDDMNVSLNATGIFQQPFRNYQANEYPGNVYPAPPAGTTVTELVATQGGDYGTSIYDIIVTGLQADSNGNAVFNFFASGNGWQGGGDESIGLDNIVVTANDASDAPEPSTWVLLAAGLAFLPLRRYVSSRG